jgi:hypothetical protein
MEYLPITIIETSTPKLYKAFAYSWLTGKL